MPDLLPNITATLYACVCLWSKVETGDGPALTHCPQCHRNFALLNEWTGEYLSMPEPRINYHEFMRRKESALYN